MICLINVMTWNHSVSPPMLGYSTFTYRIFSRRLIYLPNTGGTVIKVCEAAFLLFTAYYSIRAARMLTNLGLKVPVFFPLATLSA